MSIIPALISSVESALSQASSLAGIGSGGGGQIVNDNVVGGDIELDSITLISDSGDKKFNIKGQAKAIEIYESIIQPVVFAEIYMQDDVGLFNEFPIVGEEFVNIRFKTPQSNAKTSNYVFRVNRVKNKSVRSNLGGLTYTLELCSAELLTNANFEINYSVNDNISSVVKKILNNDLQTQKKTYVEDTRGIEEMVLTGMRPLQAIDFLRQRAVSPQFESSAFCFFENRNGFTFATLESIIKAGKKTLEGRETDKVFFFDTVRQSDYDNISIRNVLAYDQIQFGDQIARITLGGLRTDIEEYDMITGNLRRIEHTHNDDDFEDTSSSGKSFNSGGFKNRYANTTATTLFRVISSDRPESSLSEKITKSRTYALKMAQNMTKIYVYGDHEITVGDVIRCVVPGGSGEEGKLESKVDSGNYLVTKVRHMIMNVDRPVHMMAIEIAKGDLEGS